MDDTERAPDQTEDPRRQGTGQGYPESNPAQTTPREGTESGPAAGTGADEDAPATSHPEESERESSTGNPDAAG